MTTLAAPLINSGEDIDTALQRCLPIAVQQLKDEGQEVSELDKTIATELSGLKFIPEGRTVAFSTELHEKLVDIYEQALEASPNSPVRLDEKHVAAKTGFEMFLFADESKHRGFPHVTVQLQGGKINISLEENPRVLAGKRNLRGEAVALRAVKTFREKITREWDDLRPEDQKLKAPGNLAATRKK